MSFDKPSVIHFSTNSRENLHLHILKSEPIWAKVKHECKYSSSNYQSKRVIFAQNLIVTSSSHINWTKWLYGSELPVKDANHIIAHNYHSQYKYDFLYWLLQGFYSVQKISSKSHKLKNLLYRQPDLANLKKKKERS